MAMDVLNTDIQESEHRESGLHDLKLLGKLWPYMRAYKQDLAIAFTLLPLIAASDMAMAFIIRWAVDGPIKAGDLSGLIVLSGGFLALLLVHYVVRYWQLMISQRTGQLIIRDLRTDLYRHFQNLSPRFYQTHPLGKLVTRITSDIENLSEMLSSGGLAILADLAIIFGSLAGMFIMEWRLASLTVLTLGVLLLAMDFFRSRSRKAYDELRIKAARMNAFLQENFAGMELVQLYRRENRNYRYFENLNASNMQSGLNSILYSTSFNAVVEFMTLVTLVVVLWYAASAIAGGAMTYGVLAAFFLFVSRLFEPIEDVSEKYTILQSGLSSIDKVMALFQEQPEIVSRVEKNREFVRSKGDIRFDHVTFGYVPHHPVLKDMDFHLKPGETVALVGPSGAGKTTLIKLLLRFYEPTDGVVSLDGKDLRQWEISDLRRNIVSIQQDDFLFSRSVAENIALEPYRPDMDEALKTAVRQANAGELIERLPERFEHVLEERGKNLSAGEKQLILFARAFYHNPAVLILDEATSAIDSFTEERVQAGMEKLMRGRTVLIVAHRLSTIRTVDRILVMEQGRIAQDGTHEELVRQPGLYRQFYRYQELLEEKAV